MQSLNETEQGSELRNPQDDHALSFLENWEEDADPLSDFFSGIKSSLTKHNYETDLKTFFDFLRDGKLSSKEQEKESRKPSDEVFEAEMRLQVSEFEKKAKADSAWTTRAINAFINVLKQRVEKGR